ncbi:MAG: transketolase [Patescibacteria group bacterium]|nr:transketolase [Patescibacteria group bacterium]
MPYDDFKKRAVNIRKNILRAIYRTKNSHIGSCFSIVEILVALYFEVMNINPNNTEAHNRDIFILSKGHAAVALYAILVESGFCDTTVIDKYAADGTQFAGHVIRGSIPGIEISSGSLGHGLPIATGLALGAKIDKNSNRKIFCLMGDGECDEGSVWEATMFAVQKRLDNLTIIIDFNNQQGMGESREIISQDNLADKFRAFGCEVRETSGHDYMELTTALGRSNNSSRPLVIIAKTTKGKGVSFMENSVDWHYKSPSDEQYRQALKELES